MEKLIELLNEFDSGWDYDDYYGPYQYGQDRDAYIYGKYYLVSRDYGFIKWLVENDKIDRPKFFDAVSNYCEDLVPYPANETLLMLLSISNSPIDDLINYLK